MARRRSGYQAEKSRNRNILIFAVLLIIAGVIIGLVLRNRQAGEEKAEPNSPPDDSQVVAANDVQPAKPEPVADEGPSLPPTEIVVDDNTPANPAATELVGEAITLMASNPPKFMAARDKLNEALKLQMNATQRAFIKDQLSPMAEKWLFSRDVYPDDALCSTYKVQSGENLSTICSKYKVPYEIIMALNNMNRAQDLKADQTLKMIHGPFNVRIRRSTFTMDLYLQDTFVRSFRVGLGRQGRETPTGLWCVKDRLISPPWTDPDTGRRYEPNDEDYPLGTRWIGLTGLEGAAKNRTGFAIHGTKKPEEIGTATSRGCIRMYNGDVVLVYNLLVLTDSLVRVED